MSLVGRSRHDYKTQAREELWFELSHTVSSHYMFKLPPKDMCQVSSNFRGKRFRTALSISRNPALWREKENWKLRQAHTHATWYKLRSETIVPNLKQVTCSTALSDTTTCKAKVTASGLSFRFTFELETAGWHLSGEIHGQRTDVYLTNIRQEGLATQPFEDHWHTRAFTSLGPLGGKPVEHFQYVILFPLEAWDCHA